MKKLIELKLRWLAKLIVKKYQPAVIGVTGSIGKTSTREALYTVLSGVYAVRRNTQDNNNNLEALLTIIGFSKPGRGLFSLIKANVQALRILIFKDRNYPQILVLEIDVNRRGRAQHILNSVKPAVGVVASGEIAAEKGRLVVGLPKSGTAILNADDSNVMKLKKYTKAPVITYGFGAKADIRAEHVKFSYVEDVEDIDNLRGLSFKVNYNGATVPFFLPASLGVGQVYAALAAIAAGTLYELDLVTISGRLRAFRTPPGRMALVAGIKNTMILDDTYTAAMPTVLAGLDVLARLPLQRPHRRLAVIGDMQEPGFMSVRAHEEVGRAVVKQGVDLLVVVGERSRDVSRAAKKAGMPEQAVRHFAFAREAKGEVQKLLQSGDVVYVTGGGKLRMEQIVKEVMAEPGGNI